MDVDELTTKTAIATRWSTFTEIAAKLISPITNMILARLLTPEAFGVVATINMVVSFADIFTDAGFQKFLIQHDFPNRKALDDNTTVAFWTNLGISLACWGIISIFSEEIATLVGNPGLGNVISIASISLPLTSFSSIQMARYRRNFDFKTLFYVRIIGVCTPLFVTVPLAVATHSYWALVIGTIAGNFVNAFVLTVRSDWKPRLFYSFSMLKRMFMYSWWILLESISVWMTSYIGTFIVGAYLSTYYVGLYKTAMTTTNQIIGLVTSATSAPLFSALSQLQADDDSFKSVYYKYIQAIALFVVPLGVGIFLYRNLVTQILLGSQWTEAADFVGLWGVMSSVSLVLGTYCSGIFNAKGKPVFSFVSQCLHLVVLIPVLVFSAQRGFETLYVSRSLVRIQFILLQLIIVKVFFKVSPLQIMSKVLPSFICSAAMAVVAVLLRQVSEAFVFQIVSVVLCIIVYFATVKALYKDLLEQCFETLGFGIGKIVHRLKIH